MTDPIRRAIRSFAQTFIGVLVASGVFSAIDTTGVVDWNLLRKAVTSAVAAGIVAVLSLIQNAAEDAGAIPALLKAPASSGENPIPDPGPPVAKRTRRVTRKR